MGILDDAIREHLELKRAHGAAEDEVRRKEAEAFGPARQEVVAQPVEGDATQMLQPADAAALEAASDVPALEQDGLGAHPVDAGSTAAHPAGLEPEPLDPSAADPHAVHPGDHPIPDPHDHLHPGGSDPAWGDDTEFFSEPAPEQPVRHHDDEPHPALHDHEAIHSEEHPPEPVFREPAEAPGAPEAPVGPAPVEEPPVREPDVEEPPVEQPPGEEDVLEETPEFLQDAPEHDRLWFEQKPPRDFDFGE
ncbi:MAG: hypothetical protein ACJ77Z_02940 [Thermoleophilaceae bacterium]